MKRYSDAIIITDAVEWVRLLNQVAESLTGCTLQETRGKPFDSVCRIINEETRQAVEKLGAEVALQCELLPQ